MGTGFYYVYTLKDPRTSPAQTFYVGKGTGSRAFSHLVTPDSTRKYKRILDIQNAGQEPRVEIVVEDLDEVQALRIEAELISALGTEEHGGILTNSVVPSGSGGKRVNKTVTVPVGSVEKAQLGLSLIKAAIKDLAQANKDGVTNSEVASNLGLRSDYQGKQKDYLSYSILGLLLRERAVTRDAHSTRHKASD